MPSREFFSFVRSFIRSVCASSKVCMCSLIICPAATSICFLFSRKSRAPIETIASVVWIDSCSDTFCDHDNFSTKARLVLYLFFHSYLDGITAIRSHEERKKNSRESDYAYDYISIIFSVHFIHHWVDVSKRSDCELSW